MLNLLAAPAAFVGGLMLSVWLLSLVRRDASLVDLVWGLGFVGIAWIAWSQAEPQSRHLWLPILCTLWGLRLSGYLTWRNHGRPEDPRYRAMRDRHGNAFPWVSFVTVFMLQGLLMGIISLPLQLAHARSTHSLPLLIAGIAVWFAGFLFETVGDWQLARFKRDPAHAAAVLDRGLWRYTRHPNYFGDFLVWWGLYLTALASGAPWWTAIGPIVMSFLLMKLSGVPLLERALRESKPGYAAYVQQTNAFFPGPPRT